MNPRERTTCSQPNGPDLPQPPGLPRPEPTPKLPVEPKPGTEPIPADPYPKYEDVPPPKPIDRER